MEPIPHPLLSRLRAARGRSSVRRFFSAALLPARAMSFLAARRRLWPFVAVPAAINLILLVVAVYAVVVGADDVLAMWWARPEAGGLATAAWTVAAALLAVVGLVLSYFAVLLVGGVLAAPFNDALSQRVEHALCGRVEAVETGWLRGLGRSLATALLVLALYLACLVPLLLLGLVPVAGALAAAVLGPLVSAYFLALEYADAVFERRGMALGAKLRLLRARLPEALGFGLGTSLLLWIPVVNVLCIPVAVAAGTALGLVLVERRG